MTEVRLDRTLHRFCHLIAIPLINSDCFFFFFTTIPNGAKWDMSVWFLG